jgi:thiamine pyrophosphokinase
MISVFSINDQALGVSIDGLKYTLKNAAVSNAFPIGVSNEFTGAPASVEVRDGSVLIMWPGSPDDVRF